MSNSKPQLIPAWLVNTLGEIKEIEVDIADHHTLMRVSDQYFNGECVTLTGVAVERLPPVIRDRINELHDHQVQFVHFSVDDAGLLKRLPINRKMTYAYAGGSPIVGDAVVYSQELE